MSVVSSSRVLGELEFIVTEIKECLPIKYIGSDFYLVFFFIILLFNLQIKYYAL